MCPARHIPNLNLFKGMVAIEDFETTNRASYRHPEFDISKKTVYKPKRKRDEGGPPAEKKLIETLSRYKNKIPMDLFWNVEDSINRVNPRIIDQSATFTREERDNLEVQRTRPRLLISPAMALDDIEDARARNIILDDTYTSTYSRTYKDLGGPQLAVRAPLPKNVYPPNTVCLPQVQFPVVPEEWRMESCRWDWNQSRSYVDPTKEFWLRRARKLDGKQPEN